MANPTEDLVRKARLGDREAFDRLTSMACKTLDAAIARQVGQGLRQKVAVEDVRQDVVLTALQSMERFDGRDVDAFRAWLCGIARNVVRNLARRKGLRGELCITREAPADATSPSHHQRREERFARLSKSVQSLSPDHQAVIRLARLEGLRIDEIAERMGRSRSAVKNLLLRAMKALKDSFGDTESLSLPDRRLGGQPEAEHGE